MASLFSGDGIMGKAKNGITGSLDKFLDIPDKPQAAWKRKALYIIFDLGILLLVSVVAFMMLHSGGHTLMQSLQNPSITTLMSLPMIAGGAGIGIAFLLQDCLPKKTHRAASKVMAVAMPILILGGAVALILAGGKTGAGQGLMNYHFSFTKSMTSIYFFVGLLLLPMGAFALSRTCDAFQRRVPFVKGRLPSYASSRHRRPLSNPMGAVAQRRAQLRQDSEFGLRRNHESGSWWNRVTRQDPRPLGPQGPGNAQHFHEEL